MATKPQQVKHVVEGAALGVLASGIEALTHNKMALELNFRHVWRRWAPASRFPSIGRFYDPGNLFWLGIHRSERRQLTSAAWATEGPWLRPYLQLGWSLNELDECLEEFADERASAEDWREFGRLYIARFRPDELILS